MGVLAGYFGYFLYNIETHNKCYVRDGENISINPIPIGVTEQKDVSDVSSEFDEVISLFFVQSLTGAFLGFYHVLSIFLFPILLKFSFPVGLLSKLNMAFGAGLIVFMHVSRLSHSGEVCSGKYLSEDAESQEGYLITRGKLFAWYLTAFWVVIGSMVLTIIIIVIAAIKSFQ